jgi:hypothetical protein
MNKSTQRAAAAAAALIAAGIVGISTADTASAAPARISSAQLKTSIAHAVAIEQQGSDSTIGTNPTGFFPTE